MSERKVENMGVESAMNKLLARFPAANFIDVWACWENGTLKFTARVGNSASCQGSGWGDTASKAVDDAICNIADWSTFELAVEIKEQRKRLESLEKRMAGKDPMQAAMAHAQLEEKEVQRVAP